MDKLAERTGALWDGERRESSSKQSDPGQTGTTGAFRSLKQASPPCLTMLSGLSGRSLVCLANHLHHAVMLQLPGGLAACNGRVALLERAKYCHARILSGNDWETEASMLCSCVRALTYGGMDDARDNHLIPKSVRRGGRGPVYGESER